MAHNSQVNEEKVTGRYAAILSMVEVGLGSIIHAFRIPFGGQVLSLNQVLILTWAARKNPTQGSRVVTEISLVTALLKSLSPAGKKLTPMLALSMQGFLFSLGLMSFGNTFVGVCVGAALLSVWAWIQPAMIAYTVFGESFISSFLSVLPEWSLTLFLILFSAKALIAVALAYWAWTSGSHAEEKYSSKIRSLKKASVSRPSFSPVVGAFKDLIQPWFLLGLAFNLFLFLYSENTQAHAIWVYFLRPLAVGWIVFWFIRWIPQQELIRSRFQKSRLAQPAQVALDDLHSKS